MRHLGGVRSLARGYTIGVALDDVSGKVVVLTGACSGIGRETAALLTRHGAHVVAGDLEQEALDTTPASLVVPCDVTDYDAVCELARRAARHFGGIDVWINNAGVTVYGTVERLPMAEIRRVVDVDLMGPVHGMKAALPYLRRSHGTIINITSVLGKRGLPLQGPYVAAKHGVIGFSEALRVELRHAGVPVSVVDIRPSSVNTPLFEHARSHLGVRPKPPPPIYDPRAVASTVLAVIRRPVREVTVGGAGRLLELGQRVSPALLDHLMVGPLVAIQHTDEPDDGRGNLFQPPPDGGHVRGSSTRWYRPVSWYTKVFGTHPHLGRLTTAMALTAALVAVRRIGRHGQYS